jgi:hypothetical protein
MTAPKRTFVQPLDTSVLIDIWLDGFTSGCTTSFIALTEATEEAADTWADHVCKALANDPAAMETVRKEVRERVLGIPGAPSTLRVHTSDGAL